MLSSDKYCDDTDSTLQDEIESSNGSEFLGQDPAVRHSEKVKILTALPKSWSVRKIMKEFGASNYMARQAKKLVLEKGFLSSPNPKPGNPLPERIKHLFYGRGGLVLAMGAMWVVVAAARGAAGEVVVGTLASILLVPVVGLVQVAMLLPLLVAAALLLLLVAVGAALLLLLVAVGAALLLLLVAVGAALLLLLVAVGAALLLLLFSQRFCLFSCVPVSLLNTCKETSSCQYVPVEGVLQEILDNPVTEPLSPVESALQSHFVRRSLLLSPKKDVLVVKTSGKALVPTSSASHKTVKKRTKSLSDLRSVVSAGDTITQLSREVDSCTPEERAKLLEVISSQTGDFRVSISTKDALAMKTELNISWNKLRAMRRWLQMWKIDMSSESHMRVRANDLIGSNIHAEMVPLSFQHKDGGEVIKQAPIASIPHLWDRIVTVLEQNQSNGKLTWHNGVIPSEEIWIKLGGDKGGGTFKFCFQILNVAAPNSTDCTNVISLFEAADSLTNLRICLGQYIQQVADICTRIWSLVQVYSKQNAEQSSPFVMIT
eukprot:Em0007g162a